MIVVVAVLGVALAAALSVLGAERLRPALRTRRAPAPPVAPDARRILFPFLARALSEPALDAALR
ncbi:MAG: hypothetical protein ACYDHH_33830, partial [Solirubrobacteraceae bacterium]